MRKRKILALLSIVAIIGTSATALAKEVVLDTGIWYHGKTSKVAGHLLSMREESKICVERRFYTEGT